MHRTLPLFICAALSGCDLFEGTDRSGGVDEEVGEIITDTGDDIEADTGEVVAEEPEVVLTGDEYETYANQRFPDAPEKQAATIQIGQVLDGLLDFDDGQEAVRGRGVALMRASECAASVFEDDFEEEIRALESFFFDTEERFAAYEASMTMLDGANIPLRPPERWAESCTATPGARRSGFDGISSEELCNESGKTVIQYVNGINTTYLGALSDVVALQRHLEDSLERDYPDEEVMFELSYNNTQGFWTDLLEAFVQYRSESGDEEASLWDFMKQSSGLMMLALAYEKLEPVMLDQLEGFTLREATLQEHVSRYRSHLLQGTRVLLVAHSQGNFYANEAYEALTSTGSPVDPDTIGLVAVATPASTVAGGGEHLNSRDDRVLDLIVGELEGNAENTASSREDFWKHAFEEVYLDGNVTGPRLTDMVLRALGRLSYPDAEASTGAITVTLGWDEAPDVDLHVFEPNGEHVFYQNMRGQSGFLDVDDVNQYGPEHYYVSCETLEAGDYAIGVNYYTGTRPTEAWIQVQAGPSLYYSTLTLESARGSAGNASPVPAATLRVSGSADGWNFEIFGE